MFLGVKKCVRPHWTRPNIFSGANWWVLAWNHPIAWLGHDHLKSPQREELKFSIKNLLFEPNGGGSKPINLSILMGWTSINPSYFIGFTRGTKGFDSYPNGNGTGWKLDGEAMRSWWIHRIFPSMKSLEYRKIPTINVHGYGWGFSSMIFPFKWP